MTIMTISKQTKEFLQRYQEDKNLPPWVASSAIVIQNELQVAYQKIDKIQQDFDQLKQKLNLLKDDKYGKKSEKKPNHKKNNKSIKPPVKPRDSHKPTLDSAKLEEETEDHPAPSKCPKCGSNELFDINSSKEHIEYVFKPARLVRVRHKFQKCICSNRCTIVSAPSPPKVANSNTRFSPSLYAHILTLRCFDAIPLSRQADQWARIGVPLQKSVIFDLFHRATLELRPLYHALLIQVCSSGIVNADETPQPFLADGKTHRGYFWVFASPHLSAYVFSDSRSGEIPKHLLGNHQGILVADGYTGYNKVQAIPSWDRAGCMSHARRYFLQALDQDPAFVDEVLVFFSAIYEIEAQARSTQIQGTDLHLKLRQNHSSHFINQLKNWLETHQNLVLPKSSLGKAIQYCLKQWDHLCLFLSNPKIPVDNNHAERLLRRIALSRKSSFFIGSNRGESYAIAYSLVQSCRLSGINPEIYLQHVLIQIQSVKQSQIHTLLPHLWKPPGVELNTAWV